MKINISLVLLLSICIPSLSCAQLLKPKTLSRVIGKYNYVAADSLSGIRLELNKDGNFLYSAGGDLQTMYTSGKWSFNRDTLIINSSIDKKNIPIVVREEIVDSIKTNIRVELVRNLNGESMDDAVFRFNSDTTKECIPFLESGCDIKIGSIDNLRIELNNDVSSKWIRIKNKKTNLLKVTVGIRDTLGSYLFLVNQKYLYKNGKLYPLPITQITELNRSGEQIKREIALQKS
jgi:hypothetical protein